MTCKVYWVVITAVVVAAAANSFYEAEELEDYDGDDEFQDHGQRKGKICKFITVYF